MKKFVGLLMVLWLLVPGFGAYAEEGLTLLVYLCGSDMPEEA